jgi:transposase
LEGIGFNGRKQEEAMPKSLDPIQLQPDEVNYLNAFINTGRRSARAIKRAHVLLHLHAGKSTKQAGELAGVSQGTVYNLYARYRAEGVEGALNEKPRSGQPPRLNLRQQAELTTLACSAAPAGHVRWTIRLLADKAVEIGIVEHIAPETVRQFLKKTNSSLG